jgi:hypothetical protein
MDLTDMHQIDLQEEPNIEVVLPEIVPVQSNCKNDMCVIICSSIISFLVLIYGLTLAALSIKYNYMEFLQQSCFLTYVLIIADFTINIFFGIMNGCDCIYEFYSSNRQSSTFIKKCLKMTLPITLCKIVQTVYFGINNICFDIIRDTAPDMRDVILVSIYVVDLFSVSAGIVLLYYCLWLNR